MPGPKKSVASPAWLTIKDWLVLNTNELTWIVLVTCGVLLVGMVLS